MPTYEYRCDACGHRFERLQRFSDEPVRVCPECGEEAVERIISAGAGVIFKGSGFYETDYKRPSRGKPEAAEGEDGSSEAGGAADGDAGDGSPGGEGGGGE